ncbi:MAG: hypothetical protein Q7J78_05815, partial [Clostridiales bacterium]|nr:hypothetical protein [Clostridiales bacterium]
MASASEIPLQIKDYHYLRRLFTFLQRNKDLYHIRLFIPGEQLYSNEEQNIFNLDTMRGEKWYRALKNNSGKRDGGAGMSEEQIQGL